MNESAPPSTRIRTEITVQVPPERAFAAFTSGIDRWWDRAHHLLPGTLRSVQVEPFVGGRLWEENEAGDQCAWGRVLTWDPPREFAFSWLIGSDWLPPKLDAPGSRVTVTFTPLDPGTLVELVHSELDAHGPGWESISRGVESEGGWPHLLGLFATAGRDDQSVRS